MPIKRTYSALDIVLARSYGARPELHAKLSGCVVHAPGAKLGLGHHGRRRGDISVGLLLLLVLKRGGIGSNMGWMAVRRLLLMLLLVLLVLAWLRRRRKSLVALRRARCQWWLGNVGGVRRHRMSQWGW